MQSSDFSESYREKRYSCQILIENTCCICFVVSHRLYFGSNDESARVKSLEQLFYFKSYAVSPLQLIR